MLEHIDKKISASAVPQVDKRLQSTILEDIVSKIDSDGNGSVEYSEFLTHALGRKQLSESNLRSFFMIM